jgi:hypothetical protein
VDGQQAMPSTSSLWIDLPQMLFSHSCKKSSTPTILFFEKGDILVEERTYVCTGLEGVSDQNAIKPFREV